MVSPVLPPVLFAAKTSAERRRIGQLRKRGLVRAVGPGVYVSVPEPETEKALRAAWSLIVANRYPGALVSHRTALEFRPSPTGDVFITASTNRDVRYPGLTLRFVRGPGPLPDDGSVMGFRVSSQARALLENASTDRRTTARRVSRETLEAQLERILHLGGEAELGALRDRATQIAQQLGWKMEGNELDRLIGTLLGTRRGRVTSELAKARVLGDPFDPARIARFSVLFGELRTPLPHVRDVFTAPDHHRNKAFFESYFSNFIEGTTFRIEEAEEIVFDKKIPPTRPTDAHDVLGTFDVVSSPSEMRRTPGTFEAFLALVRARHAAMMARRPEAEPGTFKTRPNFAGETEFVHPDYVIGTLRKGFEMYRSVDPGLARAIFMMFLVAEVHPFVDGNGRMARIMMNAELVAEGLSTIIIPTVFRDDYLHALRALTRRDRPGPLVSALVKAQRFGHLEFSPYRPILAELERRNWFREPDEARIVE